MMYGLKDLGRNLVGLRSRSHTLRRDEFWAVDDVSFELKRGESVGLIGPNGSGKTTLLKMLNGIFWPDRGRIQVRGKVGALIAVGAGFHPLLTGRDNVYINGAILGMSKAEIERNFDAIVDFADIGDFLDTPVKHYSSGMFVRLGFAVAVHSEPDVMLVDEVLAVGDRGFQTKCFKRMAELRKLGTTFVLVSHNMHAVASFVDRVALLEKGHMENHSTFEGIRLYEELFLSQQDDAIERLVSGGDHIQFTDVELGEQTLKPGDSFSLKLTYECSQDYENVEIDMAAYDARDHELYYQATNRAYGQHIDFHRGRHRLGLCIRNIQINGSPAKVIVSIWANRRTEHLFWWRIPVEFARAEATSGRNFLPVEFHLDEET